MAWAAATDGAGGGGATAAPAAFAAAARRLTAAGMFPGGRGSRGWAASCPACHDWVDASVDWSAFPAMVA